MGVRKVSSKADTRLKLTQYSRDIWLGIRVLPIGLRGEPIIN